MEVTNCKDINGVDIIQTQFNVDGTIVGLVDINGIETPTNLSYACCTKYGYTFDPTDTKCYWADTCLTGGTYNIVLDPENNTGAFFQIDEIEEGICHLEISFKFLLKIQCETINESLKDFLETLELSVGVEKVIYDDSLPIPNNLEEIAVKNLFNIDNIYTWLDGNTNTGIILDGNCQYLVNNFLNDLGVYRNLVNETTLNSDWFEFKMVVDDPILVQSISNERLKFSIKGNSLKNFSILLDDVKMDKVCDVPEQSPFLDEDCPRFELNRVIDNKKSWVENTNSVSRHFDLDRRQTTYNINHERLSINTKEVDIAINPSQAIDNNIIKFIKENPCILEPITGCTGTTVTSHECIDLTPMVTTEINTTSDLMNLFIDVKNRKTLSAYPTLELIYYRYLNSQEHCGKESNPIVSENVNKFIELLGTYWSDLIEQVVPATTIWGSSLTNSNISIGGNTNKFVYKKSSSFFCNNKPTYSVPSPVISGDTTVGVTMLDISEGSIDSIFECNLLSVRQLDYGSEFIGRVLILGDDDGPTEGDTISIMETIGDECNYIRECQEQPNYFGDFYYLDFDDEDFYI